MDKRHLRKSLKQELALLSKEELEAKSFQLSQNLLSLLPNIKSEHGISVLKLGVFAPIQKEPKWFKSFNGNEADFYLVHMHEDLSLSFHPVGFESIKLNQHELQLKPEYLQESDTPNVILVPGLGFTKTGERIGRGKGFFDRFLENYQGATIGVCFEQQLKDNVCSEEHDVKMDYIVTETTDYRRGKI